MSNSTMNIDLEPAADSIGEAVDTARSELGGIAAKARTAVGSTIASLRDGFSSAYRSTAERASGAKDCAVDYVRENPVKSVALAVGVGALAGALLFRRR